MLASLPLFAVIAAVALFGGSPAVATDEEASVDFSYVTVHSGQDLWTIAEILEPTEDPRNVIAELVSLNQLTSSDVQPGQRLTVPLEYAD
jgi:LysM repeat protein